MNDDERRVLGQRVTVARTSRGWSKELLAEKAGITTTTLRRVEDGLRVQDAKLQLVLDVLGLGRDAESPEVYTESQFHPLVFVLPPEIERGYDNTVRFARAVMTNVPELSSAATELILKAAGLFSAAGDAILEREGGDGDAEESRGAAPMNGPLSAVDDELPAAAKRGEVEEPGEFNDLMHNKYSPWEELASLPQIELRRESPKAGRLGEYVRHGGIHGGGLIRLEPSMPRRQMRAVLCHELRHHEFGDIGTACAKVEAKMERRADSAAARLLVDIYDLADAMVIHARHPSAVAVELRVSLDVLHTRIARLHPAERAYLRRRMTELHS